MNKCFDLDADAKSIRDTVETISDRYEKVENVWNRRKIDISDDPVSETHDLRSSRGRRRIFHLHESSEDGIHVEGQGQLLRLNQGDHIQMMLRHSPKTSDVEVEGFMRPADLEQPLPSSHLPIRSHYDTQIPDGDCVGGEDRTELLRQLDVLKDKLCRSGNLIDKGKAKVPHDITILASQDPYASEDRYSLEMNSVLMQNQYPDQTPFQNQYAEPPPLMYRREMGSHGFRPPHYAPNHVHRYGAPPRFHMHRKDPHQAPAYYHTSPPRAYRSGYYQDDGMAFMDTAEPYPLSFNQHHPSCSCYQCLNQREVPAPVLPTAYSDKYSDYHNNPGSFASRDYYNRGFPDRVSLRSHNSQTHARWPSDVDSDISGYTHHGPPRVHLASGGKRCSPVAGAAPFFICSNCSELLLLSMKVLTRNKVRCGACSTLIAVAISKKSLVVSTDLPARDNNPIESENKHGLEVKNSTDHWNKASTTFSSEDYDNSGYDYHYMDIKIAQGSAGQESASKSTEKKTHHSSSPHASEADENWASVAAATKDSSSRKSEGTPPGSSLQHHLEYSSKHNVENRSEEGNLGCHSKYEEVLILPNKSAPPQISRKDSSATEIDLSSNEFNNTGTTLDSGEASRGRDNLKASRAAKSFFAGIIEESFKDSDRSGEWVEQEKANVTVNGHLIPDRLIKKAQKLAGPISPGNYWYDFRAGFWGAIGGPCLGIIPPFIQEFNYPMPEHCGGGNTNVFVNGRELNQKDLNLLGSRGLPKERDRSYIIEISGRVLDDNTGEELESLGKLAPTVERMKRGFGMRAPKAAV